MPTNVPPQYKKAEARYRAAETPEDKLEALEEMLRIMPKHKGTDKLQADLKTKIAKLKRQPKSKPGSSSHSFKIPKEGAGQIALLGPPNSGKSALVTVLTHATPKVAEYPYTTREPVPGMMEFEDITIQLIDLPPISEEHVEPWVFDQARRADLLWLVVETDGSLDGFDGTRDLLKAKHIGLIPPGQEDPEDTDPGFLFQPTLVVITGADRPQSGGNLEAFLELVDEPFPVVSVSAVNSAGLDELRRRSFDALKIFRVYTKEPGKPPDHERPFTLPLGSTVEDLARTIHREFADQLKFARIWGRSVFDGQQVQRDHGLEEGDVVELHL
jgi:ribosome-interacting GTPase 1